MRLSAAAPLTIIAGVAAVLGVIASIAVNRSAETARWARDREMAATASLIDVTLRQATRTAIAQAELLAGMPGVGSAVARQDRDWLKTVLPVFQRQRSKYGVDGVSFIRPPAIELLRLHDIPRFGDDQSAERPLLVATSRQHEAQGGLEITATSVGIRGIAPVFDNGNPVGLVEWRVGLFGVAQEIHEATKAEVTFFLDHGRLTGNRTAEERRLGPMAGLASTDWEQAAALLTGQDLEPVNNIKVDYRRWRSTDYAVVQVPLFDFAGDRVGTLAAVRETTDFTRAENIAKAGVIASALVGILACYGLVLVVLRGKILRPMGRLSTRATALARGDYSSAVSDTGRDDEVGEHAGALEKLRRNLLARTLPPAIAAEENAAGGGGKDKKKAA